MKAVSTTIYIVVAAVVILVAALVVLTIFGGGIQPVVDVTQAKSICQQQGAASCKSTGALPPTWNVPTMRVKEGIEEKWLPCSDDKLAKCSGTCSDCNFPTK